MSDARYNLTHRYVLFSCEGAAEGVIIQRLYEDGLLVVDKDRVVFDAVYSDRPYTRTRKAADIASQYLGMDYSVNGAEGLLVARIVDSRSARFELPKRAGADAVVQSFFTRPEIEMLAVHKQGAFDLWQRQSRRNRSLKPSEFCKQELGLSKIKETKFLKEYWSNGAELAECIKRYASKARRENDELMLADLLA
ncbi:hypothetical protein [Thermophilibacter provencensis]|uniref:Uncharacterized protein n=1 Tax=Thermophilibacter provencensis TaxID=1852386 RepID=A0ABT7V4Q5_9ACTN|nr:hypothetical protein [Thermophilibacter provencensis]MDM8271568.1 hypothetical protein [Thermophilibacter provencensis]